MVTITPVPPVPATPPAQAAPVPVETAPVQGDIVKLPQTLQNLDRSVTLQAQVVEVAADGTARLQTPRGMVEVKLPQPAPQAGQQVEVTLPAGAPPRNLTAQVPVQPPVQGNPPPAQQTPLPQTPTPHTPLPQTPPPASGTPQTPANPPPAGSGGYPATTPPPVQGGQPQPLPPTGQPVTGQPVAGQPATLPPVENLPASLLGRIVESGLQQGGTGMIANASSPAFAGMRPGAPAAASAMPLLQPGQMMRLTLLSAAQGMTLSATPGSMPATATTLGGNAGISGGGLAATIMPAMQQGTGTATGSPVMAAPAGAPALPTGILTGEGMAMLQNLAASKTPDTAQTNLQTPRPILLAGGNGPALAGNPQGGMVLPAGTGTPNPAGMAMPAATGAMAKAPPFMDVRVASMSLDGGFDIPLGMDARILTSGSASQPFTLARMAGFTPQGQPVVQIPMALAGHSGPTLIPYVMQVHGTMPPAGSWMAMELLPAGGLDIDGASTWPSMTQALTAASGGTVPLGQMALPQPTGAAAFSAPMLLLMNALQGGDLGGWLGERGIGNIRHAGKAALLEKLGGEMRMRAARGDQADDTRASTGEWRSANLPMLMDGSDIARLQMHWRDYGGNDDGDADNKKRGTRFIMDLSLSRMGDMQIDGLVADQKLDVVLRTGRDLSPAMRESLRQRYTTSLGAIGFSGELNFANKLLGFGDHPVPRSQRMA